MTTLPCLTFLTILLALAADRSSRDGLVWLLVGSVVGPVCTALALLMTKAASDR